MVERLQQKKSTLYFSILLFLTLVWLLPGCQNIPVNAPNTSDQTNDSSQLISENNQQGSLTPIIVKPLLFKGRDGTNNCTGTTAVQFMTVKQGGVLQHCGHQMIIPPRALSSNQIMYISVDRNNAAIADFGPDQTFNTDVKITISYANADLDDDDEDDLTIAWFDKNSGKWLAVPSAIDTKNKTVTARTNHFTQYTLSLR
jgi:hypothetical protein